MLQIPFLAVLLIAWAIAYLLWVRPWLTSYRKTAGLMRRIEAGEQTGLAWLALRLHGLKTFVLLFLTSVFTGGFEAAQALLGLDPADLTALQEPALWKVLLGDEMAIKAAAVATLAAALLLLKGKLRDVRTVPEPDGTEAG